MAFYLDTSALSKLVVAEPETAALRSWLAEQDRTLVSCDLARTELTRAVRRVAPERMVDAHAVLDGVTLLTAPAGVFAAAGRLDPVGLRSLDAVHLPAALELADGSPARMPDVTPGPRPLPWSPPAATPAPRSGPAPYPLAGMGLART